MISLEKSKLRALYGRSWKLRFLDVDQHGVFSFCRGWVLRSRFWGLGGQSPSHLDFTGRVRSDRILSGILLWVIRAGHLHLQRIHGWSGCGVQEQVRPEKDSGEADPCPSHQRLTYIHTEIELSTGMNTDFPVECGEDVRRAEASTSCVCRPRFPSPLSDHSTLSFYFRISHDSR